MITRFALVTLTLAMAAPTSAQAAEVLVTISNFTFTPAEITIHPGDSVKFRNDDDIPHLVVAKDGSFKTKALDTGDSAPITFKVAGENPYFCGLHPHMLGKVIVAP